MTSSLSHSRNRPSLKSQRLMARMSNEQKRLLQRGADIRGQTLTEFVITAAQDAATRAIIDQEVIDLVNLEKARRVKTTSYKGICW